MLCPLNELAAGCGQFFVQKQVVVKQHLAPAVVAAPVYAVNVPVYYGVGAELQYQALQQKANLQAEFQEFQRWKAQQLEATRPPAPQQNYQAGNILGQRCASCHGSQLAQPKGELYFDPQLPMSADAITAALRAVRDDRMPPDRPLSAAEKGQLMQELLELERSAAGRAPPPAPPPGS